MVHEHLLRQVPMFEECDDIFIKALVQQLKPQVLIKGDHAFRMNEPGDSMYFIQNGYPSFNTNPDLEPDPSPNLTLTLTLTRTLT